jgi:putative sigma-54 modulation protein
MNINIANRHESGTNGIRGYIESELTTLGQKFDILDADVILDKEGHLDKEFTAEINLHIKGARLHSKETSDEIGKSFDLALKTVDKQLKKHKETHFASQELKRHVVTK